MLVWVCQPDPTISQETSSVNTLCRKDCYSEQKHPSAKQRSTCAGTPAHSYWSAKTLSGAVIGWRGCEVIRPSLSWLHRTASLHTSAQLWKLHRLVTGAKVSCCWETNQLFKTPTCLLHHWNSNAAITSPPNCGCHCNTDNFPTNCSQYYFEPCATEIINKITSKCSSFQPGGPDTPGGSKISLWFNLCILKS